MDSIQVPGMSRIGAASGSNSWMQSGLSLRCTIYSNGVISLAPSPIDLAPISFKKLAPVNCHRDLYYPLADLELGPRSVLFFIDLCCFAR